MSNPPRITELEATYRSAVLQISHYFDLIENMLAHKLVDEDVVVPYIGAAASCWWDILAPLIERERKARQDSHIEPGERYQYYFERLAEIARGWSPAVLVTSAPMFEDRPDQS